MDPTQGWHSIDAQEYPTPAVSAVVEFAYALNPTATWVGKWVDIPPYTNVVGLWWRGISPNWTKGDL